MTFATGLRSILRQDPNIIMVGEIRDRETAEIAVRAALTGHLVLSTLHTNDAAGAVTRLIDMGIEPFLVASSVLGVVAQRLMRHICPECKQPYIPFPDSPEWLLVPENAEPFSLLYQGNGCIHCGNTGYRGRLAAHEVLSMSPAIRELVVRRSSAAELAQVAISEGMRTIQQDGMRKVIEGKTTLKEMVRVTYSDYNDV